jgi:hypothetical protein
MADPARFNLGPADQAMFHLAAAIRMHEDTQAPDVLRRTALTDAVDAIDVLLPALYSLRAALVAEGRRSDDETNTRVDQLLAERALPGRRQCPECKVHTSNPDHVRVEYSGPPCRTCREPTASYQVGAPGFGSGRVCRHGHDEPLSPQGILTEADVI